jgi:cytochrome b
MQYVWDVFVRASHWLLVVTFVVAYWTHDSIWDRDVHAQAGYVAGVLLLARIFWGFRAKSYANFSTFPFRPLQGLRYVWQIFTGKSKRFIGHNPAGSLVIYLILLDGLLSIGSGIWVYNDGWVPSFSLPLAEIHHDFSWAWVGLVSMHVSGVLFESLVHKENLIGAMITGYKKK